MVTSAYWQPKSAGVAEYTIPAQFREGMSSAGAAILRRNNVHVIGTDKPPMLLCNGFGCSQQIWRYLVPTLAKQYQLILFDHVGTGGSEASAYDADKYNELDGYAHDIVEICQVLNLQQVVVVGHSVGALIAMLAANQAPAHFAKAILLAVNPYCLNEAGYHGGFEPEDIRQMLNLMESSYHQWASMFSSMLTGQNTHASLGEELVNYFCTMDAKLAQRFARVAFFSDNRADLAHLHLPTLLVQCEEDVVAPAEVNQYLLAHLPQATLVTLPVGGHCPHLSAPFETLAAILNFLQPPVK